MIVAHHVGEGLLPAIVAGATAAPVLLLVLRVRLDGSGGDETRPAGAIQRE